MTSNTMRGAVWVTIFSALGCAGEHTQIAGATSDLACDPAALRSAWWSDGGPFYGGTGEIVLSADGTHMLLEDLFRSTSIRLSDGVRSEGTQPTLELTDVAGIRVAVQRMLTDAAGRSDYAGATDVFAIGTEAPLAGIPWIVPPDSAGSTQVVAHVSQTRDRAYLVERATLLDGTDRGIWLRSVRVSSPSDELRIDLESALPASTASFYAPFSILVDETRDVVFVILGRQSDAAMPSITRVELATGAIETARLAVGPAAPLVGVPAVGDPRVQLLDVTLSSDGTELYATTRDGLLRVLDASTLGEVRPPVSVGVVVANAETYLPSVRSPVASSAHDELLAMLDAQGRVVIADAASMAPLATLVSAAPTVRDPGLETDHAPRAITLRFLPDGLVVVSDAGVERFRCGE